MCNLYYEEEECHSHNIWQELSFLKNKKKKSVVKFVCLSNKVAWMAFKILIIPKSGKGKY